MSERAPGWLKPFVDYSPLVAFFAAYLAAGLFAATAALMAVTVVAVGLSLAIERRLPIMPVVTAAVVMVFGGLTLWLNDERFIKMKPTIVQALFSLVLFGGLLFGRPLLKPLLKSAWQLTDRGWYIITVRFALFFAAMAILNEIVWRSFSTDVWVNFKIFGILALTFVFTAFQVPVITRHQIPEPVNPSEGADSQ
ncbi:MAG: septation protein A [Alphaproteobacteria bacterium]|nr:septation protein A [Alphaproteobacteria bacterium]